MADASSLLEEVLLRIFHFYLQTEKQSNFVKHVSQVCKQWNRVAKDTSLFATVDGSLPLQEIVRLAKVGALQETKSLEFCELTKEHKGQYQTIFTNCPELKSLDISSVCPKLIKGIYHPILNEIVGLCPNLCEIILSPTKTHRFVWIPPEMFTDTICVRGHKLVKLDFSNALNMPLTELFLHIAINCPNLEELLAKSNGSERRMTARFYIGRMQQKLPKLKSLCLGSGTIFEDLSLRTAGFPNLEIFSFQSGYDDRGLNFSAFEALLFKSPNLRILDLPGASRNASFEDIISLSAKNLEEIRFSNTFRQGSTAIFQKWSHSLKEIEMPCVDYTSRIDDTFLPEHFPGGLPKLEVLDVNNTGITNYSLMVIIQHSPKLRFLNVKEKEIYHSRSKIEDLLLRLQGNEMDCN